MIKTSISNSTKAFIILMMINYIGPVHLSYAATKRSLQLSCQAKPVSCAGQSNGKIDLAVSGGATPYQFIWSNGSKEKDLTNISPGVYTVTVTDANSNLATHTIEVTAPAVIDVRGEVFPESCSSKNAAIKVQLSGGVKPYSFLWSDNSTTKSREDIAAGDYSLKVTDGNGCIKSTDFNVERSRDLNLSVNSYNPVCYNESTGLIDLEVNGGWAPYSYTWSNGATTEDISGLSAGNYTVIVVSNNGCSGIAAVSIKNPEPLTINASISEADADSENGSISLNVTGGKAPYTYIWSNLEEKNKIENLETGVYAVRVTDAHQCISADYFTVNEKSTLSIDGDVKNSTCLDGNNGAIAVLATGGTAPYTYLWSNGEENNKVQSLEPGLYMVIITDAKGKKASKSFTINEPEAMTIFATVKDETVTGKNNGSIRIEALGGQSPYQYNWNNGANGETLNALSSGLYTVQITDANGCLALHDVMVSSEQNEITKTSASGKMLRMGNRDSETSKDDMIVYPNPFDKNFTIQFLNEVTNVQKVEIFSTDGRLIEDFSSQSIHLSANKITLGNISLKKGSYFIKVTAGNRTYSKIVTKS